MSLSPDAIARQSQSLHTPARWRTAPVPDGFGDAPYTGLEGPVELPVRLEWSTRGVTRDLQDPEDRQVVYETVLTEGTTEDVLAYINPVLLLEDWDSLTIPPAVRETWQPWITQQTT